MIGVKLRPSQVEAISVAKGYRGFGLFAEQRVGKTLMGLRVVQYRKPRRLLIGCPLRAIKVWEKAISENPIVDDRGEPAEIKILNLEQIHIQRARLRKWLQAESLNSMFVLDEAHRIKRKGSKISRAARNVAWLRSKGKPPRARATYRLALTGTPIAQGVQDAWAIFDFINPEIFGTWEEFEEKHIVYGGFKNKKIVGYRNKKLVHRKIHENSYRVTLREAQGEGSRYIVRRRRIYVELPPTARMVYRKLEKTLEAIVNRKKVSVPIVVAVTTKLQQICGGFVKANDETIQDLHQMKLLYLRDLIRSHSGKKIVICSRFLYEIEAISALVYQEGKSYTLIKGGEEFEGELETDIAIVQIQSGIAIDLAKADVTIFYSWDYSHINHEQMKFRTLSFSKRYVSYYYLIARGTVDELIYEAVTRKKKLADVVCDHFRRRM